MRDLYLAGIWGNEDGTFVRAAVKAKGIEGTLLDVYGTSHTEAKKKALELIAIINIGSAFLRERMPAMFVVWRDNVLMTFNTAHEVAIFLWGREVAEWHILKDGIVVSPITSLNISEIERYLEES